MSKLRQLGDNLRIFHPSVPPVPELGSDHEVKQFCEGLLQPGIPHPWRGWADVAPSLVRETVQHSLFLFRKIIPVVGDPQEKVVATFSKLTTPTPASDPEFLDFCSREIPKLFKSGWDRAYTRKVSVLTLPTSACLERSRGDGGARAVGDVHWCQRFAFGSVRRGWKPKARLVGIRDGCKTRVVTASSWRQCALSPLHHTLYDHLSRKEWLVRGDAKSSQFKDFTLSRGEVFVSGDYESATDNIPLDIYQHLLREVAKTSKSVPASVWDQALRCSESEVFVPSVDGKGGHSARQQRGQLMGNFLSFPFLCLLNFLAFKFSVPRQVPLRINGDDIVWRGSERERERWFQIVERCGLTLSVGKTMVSSRAFTLNSVLFRAGASRAHASPFIRSRAWFNRPESVSSAIGQFRELGEGLPPLIRRSLQVDFLVRHRRVFWASRRSLSRGLEMRVPDCVIRMAGYWHREQFYLSFDNERELPPVEPGVIYPCVPSGYTRVDGRGLAKCQRRACRENEHIVFQSMGMLARIVEPRVGVREDYWRRVRADAWAFSRPNLGPGLHRYWVRLCSTLGSRKISLSYSGVKRMMMWSVGERARRSVGPPSWSLLRDLG